jgi:hypothetical protein
MTEETGKEEAISPEKLQIDNPSDFQFHAAYVTYAEIYDKISDTKIREELNQSIEALKESKIDYSEFYRKMSPYRAGTDPSPRHGRSMLKTQRKREWRRAKQKRERIKRHKR